jgi:tyrosyl-tRNA synthetase
MNLLEDLKQRGLVKDCTNEEKLNDALSNSSITLYCGFDPTADSLHVGSLLPLINLIRFKLNGHKPIALIGGATGMIGDPSGKNDERTLQDSKTIDTFKEAIENQIKKISLSCSNEIIEVVDNFSWTKNLSIIDFLRDIGKDFTVNSMLAKESVKNRIGRDDTGISFTEFSYMLLQSMDFLRLFEDKNCTLQIGGSDQWGNITSGKDLIRKKHFNNKVDTFGLTFPLLTKRDGSKFGKSESGNIWLDPSKTSPFKFFQFWLSTPDSDIEKIMMFLSLKSVDEILEIIENDKFSGVKPLAHKILAEEMTLLVHGSEGLKSAERITRSLFESRFEELTMDDFKQLANDGLPVFKISDSENLADAMIINELASSKRQAREFIVNGAVSVNGLKINDVNFKLDKNKAIFDQNFIIKRGKKNVSLSILQ